MTSRTGCNMSKAKEKNTEPQAQEAAPAPQQEQTEKPSVPAGKIRRHLRKLLKFKNVKSVKKGAK